MKKHQKEQEILVDVPTMTIIFTYVRISLNFLEIQLSHI